MSGWAHALDEFERRLAEFHALLSSDQARPPAGLWPPPDVVDLPLPAELADRARALLAEAAEIEQLLLARQAELPVPRVGGRTVSRYRAKPTISTISTEL